MQCCAPKSVENINPERCQTIDLKGSCGNTIPHNLIYVTDVVDVTEDPFDRNETEKLYFDQLYDRSHPV